VELTLHLLKDGDEFEEEREGSKTLLERSLGYTSFDKRELRLAYGPVLVGERRIDIGLDHFAEAGVAGDLNTLLSDRGQEEEAADEKGSDFEEMCVDSPTQPKTLSETTRLSHSKPALLWTMPVARPSPFIAFQESLNLGFSDGDPMAEDDTEAPDSDEAERIGGWLSKECEAELGDPAGLYWKVGFTPWAMPS